MCFLTLRLQGQNKIKLSNSTIYPFIQPQVFENTRMVITMLSTAPKTVSMPKINADGSHNPFYFHNMPYFQVKQDIKLENKVEMSEKWVFHTRIKSD